MALFWQYLIQYQAGSKHQTQGMNVQINVGNNWRWDLFITTDYNKSTTGTLLHTCYFAAGHNIWEFPGPKLKENYY